MTWLLITTISTGRYLLPEDCVEPFNSAGRFDQIELSTIAAVFTFKYREKRRANSYYRE
jgi:hypothetical protein